MNHQDSGLEASITVPPEITPEDVTCYRCRVVQPPSQPLQLIVDKRTRLAKKVCQACIAYAKTKTTTVRRAEMPQPEPNGLMPSTIPPTPPLFHGGNTGKGTAVYAGSLAAQRGAQDAPRVQALGNINIALPSGPGLMAPPLVPPRQPSSAYASPYPPILAPSPDLILHQGGPQIVVQGRGIPYVPPGRASSALGYSPAHAAYDDVKAEHLRQNYARLGGTVANVTVGYYYVPDGKHHRNKKLIRNITEVVPNITLSMGAAELKHVMITALAPQFAKAYRPSLVLSSSDITLRNASWVALRPPPPGYPDCDALRSVFQKTKNGKVSYQGGSTNVFLELSWERYMQLEAALEETLLAEELARKEAERIEAEREMAARRSSGGVVLGCTAMEEVQACFEEVGEEIARETHPMNDFPSVLVPPASGHRTAPSKRPRSPTASNKPSEQQAPATPPSKRVRGGLDTPPNHEDLAKALQSQQGPTPNSLKQLLAYQDAQTLRIFFCEHKNLRSLIREGIEKKDIEWTPPKPYDVVLDSTRRWHGTFKKANIGQSVGNPIFGAQTQFCAKQAFYTQETSTHRRQKIIYTGQSQIEQLLPEIQCLRYGRALHAIANEHIRVHASSAGDPPFPIPYMEFVQFALASGEGEGADHQKLKQWYLLEEVIPQDEFAKYISNGTSEIVYGGIDKEGEQRAYYLATCQHIQYYKTNRLAFIADYQGGHRLLTDPQIMTNPNLGKKRLFAGGNVPLGFSKFESTHACNPLCVWLPLPTNYGEVDEVGVDMHGVEGSDMELDTNRFGG